ncbi:MAG: S8 family peptidase [Hyphomonadaceae bacterium]
MTAKKELRWRHARWLGVGAALLALSACDAVQSRLDALSELTDAVAKQINTEILGAPPEDPLTAAPLEARALNGVRIAATEVAPVSLDEMLSTQSFYAVGSVIAQPKAVLVEPVVEDIAVQDDGVIEIEPEVAEAAPEAAAGAPESSELQAAPPPAMAAPAPVVRERALKTIEGIRAPEAAELVERSIEAPKALKRDLEVNQKEVSREALLKAREVAADTIRPRTEDAQRLGDEIVRRSVDKSAPMPRELAARSKLNVEKALPVRERAYAKLDEMGLSGIVVPEESGEMRIVIGVDPTKFVERGKFDPSKVDAMRARFARHKKRKQDECKGDITKAQMQADPVLATECVVKQLEATGDFEYVEKDYIFMPQLIRRPKSQTPTAVSVTPNDPLFSLQWNFKDNGGLPGQSAGGASFSNFWNRAKTTGSRSVTVAVIDTGLQMSHPDIKDSPNVAKGFDMVSDLMVANDGDGRDADPNDPGDKCDPSDPTSSDTFHGTHVAGTIGAASTDNAAGVAGGAWNVTIVPVRALGRCGGRLSDINDAIRWAAGAVPARDGDGQEVWVEKQADIINMSIGLFEPCPASMQAAINDAVARGSMVVVAAGNDRIDTKYYAPASCDNVIVVAAGDARGVLTPYSNFGEDVDIMAPGGDMTRDDDGDGRPDGVLSTKYSTDCYDPAHPNDKVPQCFYAYESGTSMAAPHVSAALALLKAKFPTDVPSQLRDRLLAASTARTALQCSGKCSTYPGTSPIPGQDGMCYRPCGGLMLNLANAAVQ